MPFDLATAKPVDAMKRGGFDLFTAKPIDAGGTSISDQIPGGRRVIEKEQPSGFMDKAIGAGETALSAVSSLGAIPAASGQLLASRAARGLGISDPSKKSASDEFSDLVDKYTYTPTTPKGKEYTTRFGEMVESTKIPPWPVTSGLPRSRAGAAAVESGLRQGAKAIAASPEADLLRAGVSKAKGALPTIEPDRAALARKAQALGIDLRPDMLTDNKFARIVGQALEDIPLSGSKVEQRQEAFNRALIGLIGGDEKAGKLAPNVFAAAMDKSGGTIGEIFGKTPIPLEGGLADDLTSHLAKSSKQVSDVAKVVQGYIQELKDHAVNGVIPGTEMRRINTDLGRAVRSAESGDLRYALADLQDDMRAALGRQLSGEDLAALQDASKKYAIGIKLIPMVAKSPMGDISPTGLMQAVTNDKSSKRAMAFGRGGDVGDLAKIGQVFLKEPKSSGTAERGLVYSSSLTDAVKYGKLAALYPFANIYNRAGPAISRGLTGFNKPENKPFSSMVASAQPDPVSYPRVPGAAPAVPGTESTLLQPAAEPNVPMPQLPPALLSGLEKQLGVPGSSISLGEQQGRTPLPAIPPQETGLLSTVEKRAPGVAPAAEQFTLESLSNMKDKGRLNVLVQGAIDSLSAAGRDIAYVSPEELLSEVNKIVKSPPIGGVSVAPTEMAAIKAVEMKLRPEVIDKVRDLRAIYADEKRNPIARQVAALEVAEMKGTYPGFVADLEKADATFKMLYETGKGTALPIEKAGRSGPSTTTPNRPPAPPTPGLSGPIAPRFGAMVPGQFPEVPGAPPILPGRDFGSMLRSTAAPEAPLPAAPRSAPEIISSLKALLGEDKPALSPSASAPVGKFEATSLMQAIRKKGGIDKQEIRDITGESRVGRGVQGLPPNTFKTEGRTLGELAQELADEGWAIDTSDVDGGVAQLRELIRDELDGNKVYSIADTDRQTLFEYNERMIEQGEARLSVEEQDQLLQLADQAPRIELDVWQDLTEAQKNAELDKLFGEDTNPKSKGKESR